MKIISFPHYTCGGLMCDIMNDSFSPLGTNGGIQSIGHSFGKIGDSESVFTDFDQDQFMAVINNHDGTRWIGTHCWLGNLDQSIDFQVINITTMTYKSRVYRWTRAWFHYYIKSQPWQGLTGIAAIDKQRETAKNYLKPFEPLSRSNCVNLEFADVVECNQAFLNCVGKNIARHMERWREINFFLYQSDLWTSCPAQRFHEAEYENLLNQSYVYQ